MSSSFAIHYAVIDASSATLEVLIARLLPTNGIAKEATFPIVIKLLIAIGFLFACTDGEWAMLPSCTSNSTCDALL